MSFSGYDIEDAIILNRSSLDRGYARCVVYRKFTTTCKKYASTIKDTIAPPPVDEHGNVRCGEGSVTPPGRLFGFAHSPWTSAATRADATRHAQFGQARRHCRARLQAPRQGGWGNDWRARFVFMAVLFFWLTLPR